ncbi:MAG: class I SAM-dependent methyltransferase [Flavobacteriales bacterium]
MKKEEVKTFFEKTEIYFHFDYNIKLRTEIVAELIGNNHYNNALDMPCGNGMISLKNIKNFNQLTLVDFSENMIALAKGYAAQEKINNVSFFCGDIFDTNFNDETFDIIISLGILAHVDDVDKFLTFIQSKVKKGGVIVIQNTNSSHFYSKLIRLYLGVRQLMGKDKYKLNKVPASQLENSFKKAGFTLQKTFRYNQSFIGFSKLFSNDKKYELTRKWFGNVVNNKNASLGSDYIYLFKKD